MFNLKKEKKKKKTYLSITILFTILTFIGAILLFVGKVNNAGYSVIPMLFTLIFSSLYRNSKKLIEKNTK